jgi:WD40 repeat protein
MMATLLVQAHPVAGKGPVLIQEHKIDHHEGVHSLACSPNGKLLATAGDHAIRLWGFTEGKPAQTAFLAQLQLGLGGAKAIAFSADSNSLAVGCGDKTVRLYDAAEDKLEEREVIKKHNKSVNAVAFSRDGKLLATGDSEEIVRVWSMAANQVREYGVLKACKTILGVKSVAFAPDSKMLATGCGNGTVQLWDVRGKTAYAKATLKLKTTFVAPLAFSPDGKALALSNESFVILLDLSGRILKERSVRKEHTEKVLALAFSPDGKLLASAGEDGRIVLWSSATGKKMLEVQRPGKFTSVAFVPVRGEAAGETYLYLVAGNMTGAVYLFHFGAGR